MEVKLKMLRTLILILILTVMMFSHSESQASAKDHEQNHHFAVFGGLTSNFEAKHTDFSFGVDYEFRLPIYNHKIGIGLLGDYVLAKHYEIIVGLPVFIHPAGGLKIFTAPGFAIVEGVSEKHFVLRIGSGYDFHLGRFSLGPVISADLIEGHVSLVYGMTFGLGF